MKFALFVASLLAAFTDASLLTFTSLRGSNSTRRKQPVKASRRARDLGDKLLKHWKTEHPKNKPLTIHRAKKPKATHNWKDDCTPLKKLLALQVDDEQKPGVGMNPDAITPFVNVYKDGFTHVSCSRDRLFWNGDKHGKNKFSYKLGSVSNVSIIRYTEMVPKQDRELMTHEVCFRFCRTIEFMGYFGIHAGRDCYCAPYFQEQVDDSSQCDTLCEGDQSLHCGGYTKSSVYEMHNCGNTAEDLAAEINEAMELANKTFFWASEASSAAYLMTEHANYEQKVFGLVGDVAASALLQQTKVWAGEIAEASGNAVDAAETLQEAATAAQGILSLDFTLSENMIKGDKMLAKLIKAAQVAKKSKEKTNNLVSQAGRGHGSTGRIKQYMPIMYFVDRDLENVPSTASGDWDKQTLYGATSDECAAACDHAHIPECQGFMYMGNLCFLFSRFVSVTYYTGCEGKNTANAIKFLDTSVKHHKPSFLQAAKIANASEQVSSSRTKAICSDTCEEPRWRRNPLLPRTKPRRISSKTDSEAAQAQSLAQVQSSCPWNGQPVWDAALFDSDGIDSTSVCNFMGMIPNSGQADTQANNNNEDVMRVWRKGSCSSYSDGDSRTEVTRNGITLCKVTFAASISEAVWKTIDCDCQVTCADSMGIVGYEFTHNGFWNPGYDHKGKTADNQACADICSNDPTCVGFSRHHYHNECYIYASLGTQVGGQPDDAFVRCKVLQDSPTTSVQPRFTTPDPSLADPSAPDDPEFHLENADMTEMSLESGSSTGRILVSNVGIWDNIVLNMVITMDGDYYGSPGANRIIHDLMVGLSVQVGKKVRFKFQFQNAADNTPVVLPYFAVTVFDLDKGKKSGETEVLTIRDFDAYYVSNHSTLLVTEDMPDVEFKATARGYKCDNPSDPQGLQDVGGGKKCKNKQKRVDQRDLSVGVTFRQTSDFAFTFENAGATTKTISRNLLVGFVSDMVPSWEDYMYPIDGSHKPMQLVLHDPGTDHYKIDELDHKTGHSVNMYYMSRFRHLGDVANELEIEACDVHPFSENAYCAFKLESGAFLARFDWNKTHFVAKLPIMPNAATFGPEGNYFYTHSDKGDLYYIEDPSYLPGFANPAVPSIVDLTAEIPIGTNLDGVGDWSTAMANLDGQGKAVYLFGIKDGGRFARAVKIDLRHEIVLGKWQLEIISPEPFPADAYPAAWHFVDKVFFADETGGVFQLFLDEVDLSANTIGGAQVGHSESDEVDGMSVYTYEPPAQWTTTTTTTITTTITVTTTITTTLTTTTTGWFQPFGHAKVFVKFEDFQGVSLAPDPSGKCKLCLKEARESKQCFGGPSTGNLR